MSLMHQFVSMLLSTVYISCITLRNILKNCNLRINAIRAMVLRYWSSTAFAGTAPTQQRLGGSYAACLDDWNSASTGARPYLTLL